MSNPNSPTGDVALPDAPPADPSAEAEGAGSTSEDDTRSPVPKTEPHTDPPEPASSPLPNVKEGEIAELENLFADDDDDEDFFGETNDADMLASEVGAVSIGLSIDPSDPQTMLTFYRLLFPFRPLFQWLNHSVIPSTDFGHREFAFTLQNDAYLRYQSFPTFEILRKEILRLNPSRFEIGPVYSANPRDRKALKPAFRPLTKELVFDIDLTDYDEVRTCCDKANICNKCWNFVTLAIKVIDVALKDDLGFKHVLWVYSGRRGAHAWVCDKRARCMDDAKRRAVASYLEVVKGGAQAGKKVNLWRPLHPHLARSLAILKERFETDILINQDPWRETKKAERLLQLLPDKALNDALRKKWESHDDRPSISKWTDINHLAEANVSKTLKPQELLEHKEDIVLEYMYPRLDVEVSKHLNHLLKSPFCVHPGTGRVCVPIDSRDPEGFDPMAVPTVTQLLNEVDEFGAGPGDAGGKIADYEKTSLKPYIDYFKSFVSGLIREETRVKRQRDGNGSNVMEF